MKQWKQWRQQTLLVTLVMIGASSCTQLKYLFVDPLPPKVTLQNVKVKAASLKQISLVAELQVDNPNDFEIEISETRYQVFYKGQALAEGLHQQSLILAATAQTTVALGIDVETSQALELVSAYLGGLKTFKLDLEGHTTIHSGFGSFDVSFHENREVNL